MTRRQLLAASLVVPGFAEKAFGAFDRPLGVQIYTVRSLMPEKGAETLRAIAAIGYKEVEIGLDDAKKYAAVLKETGLTASASHISADPKEPHQFDEFIAQAKELGIPAIGVPYVMPNQRAHPEEFWPKFVETLNWSGERCKAAGLTFYYHHHNFEFDPKFRAMDLLREKLSKNVMLEIDCFWSSVAGTDPVTLIRQWSGRIFALHLKDKAKGTPISYDTDKVKQEEFREVGAGMIDWSKVLKVAASADVRHYYVEQDYAPGDPIESLRKSYNYLRKVS